MSNTTIKRGYCSTCSSPVKIERPRPNHILHLLLTILTCGAWSLIWISIGGRVGGWHCTECGSDKEQIKENYTTLMSLCYLAAIILALYHLLFV